MPTLEMIRDDNRGLKIKLGRLVKLEGCINLSNQFHVSECIHNKEVGLVDGVDQFKNTYSDVEGVESGVMGRFTQNNN